MGYEYPVLYSPEDLISVTELESRVQVRHVLLCMRTQLEGRGLRGITENLLSAIAAEEKRLTQEKEKSPKDEAHLKELLIWNEGLAAIQSGMKTLDEMRHSTGDKPIAYKNQQEIHPLSRHGFTNHGLYSAAWNRHEASARQSEDSTIITTAYQKLQWWWMRVQAHEILDKNIKWEDYFSILEKLHSLENSTTANKTPLAFLGEAFQAVGRSIRRLSLNAHRDFLVRVAEYCLDDISEGLYAFKNLETLASSGKLVDAGILGEQQSFANSFRQQAEKIFKGKDKKDKNFRKGGSGGKSHSSSGAGYLGGHQTLDHGNPPENLPEFTTWIPDEEVISTKALKEDEDDDGVEAPRRTGLRLVNPDALRGHMARAKAQSHHLAMLRQAFLWDQNTLSSSERKTMVSLVNDVKSSLIAPIPDEWWPKAIVATAWMCGRSLNEALSLNCLKGTDLGQANEGLLAVGEINGICYWRWPLRLPNQIKVDNYTGCIPRVDHVLVPDCTGLAAVLVRAHQIRNVQQARVFGWMKSPQKRLAKAEDILKDLRGEVVDRHITEPLIARDLRITLLNMAPDKTIAWMLAGTTDDAREPRMFYAAHTPDELADWAMKAHSHMGVDRCGEAPVLNSAASDWPQNYAGAKFLPHLASVRSLVWRARERAGRFPSPDSVVKPRQVGSANKPYRKKDTPTAVPLIEGTPIDAAFPPWNDEKRWQQWHDDVVFWVWLVQALQTSQRATRFPVSIYQQWLEDAKRSWVSLEDKRTADRDESRAGVITPMLSSAFTLLTKVQALYRRRWEISTNKKLRKSAQVRNSSKPIKSPYGFVVFGDGAQPKPLTPAWVQTHLKARYGLDWPVNFNRALLRRTLSQLNIDGDGLDAFLGHGSLADRIHDRHSMFNVGDYHHQLRSALKASAAFFDLKRLDLPVRIDLLKPKFQKQRKQALNWLRNQAQESSKKSNGGRENSFTKSGADKNRFDEWKKWTASILKCSEIQRSLDRLKSWHALLMTSGLTFANYVLGISSPLQVITGPRKPEAFEAFQAEHKQASQDLENQVIEWVANGEMKRTVAAHGLNLSYLLCKALDPMMPTMRVAMTARARVSPFTPDRIARAVEAQHWRDNCIEVLRKPPFAASELAALQNTDMQEDTRRVIAEEASKVKLALCSFMNMTANSERWSACVNKLLEGPEKKSHLFETSFDYKIKGPQEKMREVRGFLDVLTTHVPFLPPLAEVHQTRLRDLYRSLRPESAKVPSELSEWVQGMQWFGHMHLPPLVASHLEGSLNDQSVQGPLARLLGWSDEQTCVKTRTSKGSQLDSEDQTFGLEPFPVVYAESSDPPFGWVPGLNQESSEAGKWLRAFLWDSVGGPSETTALEDLSDALMDACDEVPSMLRKKVVSLTASIRKHHGLPPDDEINSSADKVDRHVVDFDTYNQVLEELAVRILTSRMPERQTRMRLLIVLAFRFGMRRREILFLRRGDIDLPGDGRIHIRPYKGHSLKTGFSRRSLPIVGLLNEQEQQWLTTACHESASRQSSDPLQALLFPLREHDTLTRDAISLLRNVGKDKRLKLHHLRHSFASWMALKIVFARRPEWIEVFAGHPAIHREMRNSRGFVGSLLKPQLSSGDFLVIPRMLGHSSYEVSLTSYVHTLDFVSALYVHHELSRVIVPDRDLVHLVNERYQTAVDRRDASVSGYAGAQAAVFTENESATTAPLLSSRLQEYLLVLKKNSAIGEKIGDKSNSSLLTPQQLQNWHAPRHAAGLREKILLGIDRLSSNEVALLNNLGKLYWRDNPPMFWFRIRNANQSQRNNKAASDTPGITTSLSNAQQDLAELLRLLQKMQLTDSEVSFWKYEKAPLDEHQKIWGGILNASVFTANCFLLGGTAAAIDTVGVAIGMNDAKRSPLMGILLKVLGQMVQPVIH